MNRRTLLRQLLAGSALTAAGLYVPTKTYSFLWNNPLAEEPMGLLGMIDDDTYANMYFLAHPPKPGTEVHLTGICADDVVSRYVYSGDKLIATREGPTPPVLVFPSLDYV